MSRNKGSKFERHVAGLFGAWWGCDFKRTPMSGGSVHASGDIVPVAPAKDDPAREGKLLAVSRWPFSVECKAQEGWSVDQLLTSPSKSSLAKFLRQCFSGAKRERSNNDVPLLVAKRNNFMPLVFVQCSFDLRESNALCWLSFLDNDGIGRWVWVYSLEDFLKLPVVWVLEHLKP